MLVLFQASHAIEHKLTRQAEGNFESLINRVPETASLVDLDPAGAPKISEARDVPVESVKVDRMTLVMPGQQV